MLSFEFSFFDLVLSLGVIILIVLFVTTLWKLNPTSKKEQSQDEASDIDVHESSAFPSQPNQTATPQNVQHGHVDSWRGTERSIPQKTQQVPRLVVSATTEGVSQESPEHDQSIRKASESVEPTKPLKAASTQKQVSRSSDWKDCLHEFGYLHGLPRNTPIPGECFGCQRIVDCLVTKKK